MNSITQDMKYRYSLMKYAEKYGVSRGSRKYNKSRSYIYFWKKRFDGTMESLACESRRPHYHPKQHTEEELRLIRNMRRRNPKIGVVDLWARMRQRGYSRCVESLWQVLRREGMAEKEKPKQKYRPKPYEQMHYPGQRSPTQNSELYYSRFKMRNRRGKFFALAKLSGGRRTGSPVGSSPEGGKVPKRSVGVCGATLTAAKRSQNGKDTMRCPGFIRD